MAQLIKRIGGFPHSEIVGSKVAHTSPTLIAACHVLHRLYMPRHPPNALTSRLRVHTTNDSTGSARRSTRNSARAVRRGILVWMINLSLEIRTIIKAVTMMSPDKVTTTNPVRRPSSLPPRHRFEKPIHNVKERGRTRMSCHTLTHGNLVASSLDIRISSWWSLSGSNRRPQACKASALPTELRPLSCVTHMGRCGGPSSSWWAE